MRGAAVIRRCGSSGRFQSFQQIWKATTVLPVPVAMVSKNAVLALQDRLDGAVDGDLLVVARRLSRRGGSRASRRRSAIWLGNVFAVRQAVPQFVGVRESYRVFVSSPLGSRTRRCRGRWWRRRTSGRGFRRIPWPAAVRRRVSCSRPWPRRRRWGSRAGSGGDSRRASAGGGRALAACDHDAAVGERPLLADLVVGPAGRVELRQDVLSAGVGFGENWHSG